MVCDLQERRCRNVCWPIRLHNDLLHHPKRTPAVGAAGEERKEREEEKGVELSGTYVPDQLFADMFY